MYKKRKVSIAYSPELAQIMATAEQFSFLEPEEEKRLARELRHGTKDQKLAARNRLVTSHLKFAASVARPYFVHSRVPQEELFQQAVLGLFLATNKFDGRFRFATYAFRWVDVSVRTYAQRFAGVVHTTPTAQRKQVKVRRAVREGAVGVSIEDLAKQLRMKPSEFAMYMTLGNEYSLNAPVGDGSEEQTLEHLDLLTNSDEVNPLADLETEQMHDLLRQALALLDDRERQILMARNGVGQDDESSLEELAQVFNISRERVRQIEVRAKEKLRESAFAEKLKGFID
jgi:RNA polymerase sigma-32 factor